MENQASLRQEVRMRTVQSRERRWCQHGSWETGSAGIGAEEIEHGKEEGVLEQGQLGGGWERES